MIDTTQNKAFELDSQAGTFTAWDHSGNVTQQRALTTQEAAALAAEDAQNTANTNRGTLQARAQTAIANNVTFLGLASPTNAQTLAQVQSLTKQVDALIKLALGLLSDASGT